MSEYVGFQTLRDQADKGFGPGMSHRLLDRIDELEEERDLASSDLSVTKYERDQLIEALLDAYVLLPPDRVQLLRPDTNQLIGLVTRR